jgi:serine/threonine protein kinase
MSPEHVEGGAMDGRGDIYSLGCVAYEILTGQPPWVGLSLGDILERQRRERLPPIHASRSDIPAWLEDVVARAIAKRPEDRWPDMKAFAAALGQRSPSATPTAGRGGARILFGVGVSLIGATTLFLAGRSNGAATASAVTTRLPSGPTQVDPRLLADQPSVASDPTETGGSNEPTTELPARAAAPQSPIYDDTEALRLLDSAVSAQGTPDGFRLIPPLNALSRLETVSPPIRGKLQSLANSIRRQCIAAAALDESIICG